ncbi:hypothetical protein RIdsm_01807 [Roseovarius indicus]|uniref:DUF302 domain-containing protein n=2 Tax=Roseovarius indicus TaxID=540747 RepID=A0A0T5PDQ2_9RHOB|nr:hypothetical protein XM52_05085 [Roseovarius indicus]QEW26013.1 hypothetical protein RIdsm_01807 [Roseovarius indicus]SFD91866.1 Uncharacterized conserved protein, DUF302 family [Roseovarius indicus]
MKQLIAAMGLGVLTAGAAMAQDVTAYDYEGSFDDASFALENAIIGQGLVVDHVSHVGEMLARTREDVGSDVKLFEDAVVMQFCSAILSRKMMEADPLNIAHCPYGIFVTERGGKVQIGYRNFPEGEMQEVQSFLDGIVQEALD